MKILFIGDIVGEPGRYAVAQMLPRICDDYSPDFVIANAENAAGGVGITKETARPIFDSGVNVITLGNHAWSKRDSHTYIDQEQAMVRPANYPSDVPGRGWSVYTAGGGRTVGVINLCGRVFMDSLDNPFKAADDALKLLSRQTKVIVVDFHGEATSEKMAFAWYMDGRVSAVIGTHTHVQTADERILPGGTAYITDAGMTGPRDSVIGVRKELVVSKFLNHMPSRFEVAGGPSIFSAVAVDVDSGGHATHIERLQFVV